MQYTNDVVLEDEEEMETVEGDMAGDDDGDDDAMDDEDDMGDGE